jgi:hypothetical protein
MVGKVTPDNIITASRVPALLNASPYETPNDVLKKCIDAQEGKPRADFKQNEAMMWGDALEPAILAMAAERLGLSDTKFDYDEAFFHEKLPLACSLDGAGTGSGIVKTNTSKGIYCVTSDEINITGRGVLEAKNTGSKPETTPALYRGPLQLQAQMMCTNAQWGAVCVLYGGNELRIFVYEAQGDTQEMIANAILDFEKRKKNYDWYPIFSSDDGNTAYPMVDDAVPELEIKDSEALDYLTDLADAHRDKKIAESRINEAEAGLKEFLGSHESAIGMVGNKQYRVKWPMRQRRASAEKVIPAKPAETYRQKTLTLKELD